MLACVGRSLLQADWVKVSKPDFGNPIELLAALGEGLRDSTGGTTRTRGGDVRCCARRIARPCVNEDHVMHRANRGRRTGGGGRAQPAARPRGHARDEAPLHAVVAADAAHVECSFADKGLRVRFEIIARAPANVGPPCPEVGVAWAAYCAARAAVDAITVRCWWRAPRSHALTARRADGVGLQGQHEGGLADRERQCLCVRALLGGARSLRSLCCCAVLRAAPHCVPRALIAARHAIAMCSVRGMRVGGEECERCRALIVDEREPAAHAVHRCEDGWRNCVATGCAGVDVVNGPRKLRRVEHVPGAGCGGGGEDESAWEEMATGAEYVTLLRRRRPPCAEHGGEAAAHSTVLVRGGLVTVASAAAVGVREWY